MAHEHQEVSIHIDKPEYKSPNPTTGAALYDLGSVGPDYELWLEVPGPHEDKLIPRDNVSLEVKIGSHFYTVKKTLNPGNGRRS